MACCSGGTLSRGLARGHGCLLFQSLPFPRVAGSVSDPHILGVASRVYCEEGTKLVPRAPLCTVARLQDVRLHLHPEACSEWHPFSPLNLFNAVGNVAAVYSLADTYFQ